MIADRRIGNFRKSRPSPGPGYRAPDPKAGALPRMIGHDSDPEIAKGPKGQVACFMTISVARGQGSPNLIQEPMAARLLPLRRSRAPQRMIPAEPASEVMRRADSSRQLTGACAHEPGPACR